MSHVTAVLAPMSLSLSPMPQVEFRKNAIVALSILMVMGRRSKHYITTFFHTFLP